MTSKLSAEQRFLRGQDHRRNICMYDIALHCLNEDTQNTDEWKAANRLLAEACELVRELNHSEGDFDVSMRLFLSALAKLEELGLDLDELVLLAVSPMRNAEAREGFGLSSLGGEA